MFDLCNSPDEKLYLVLHRFGYYSLLPVGNDPYVVLKNVVRDRSVGLGRLVSHRLTEEDFSQANVSLEKGALVWVKRGNNLFVPHYLEYYGLRRTVLRTTDDEGVYAKHEDVYVLTADIKDYIFVVAG